MRLDSAQLDHLAHSPWMTPDMCTCRTREDGTRWYVCHRKACGAAAQVCGGNCRPCFDRKMHVAGMRPEVVVLCGSTRFRADFER